MMTIDELIKIFDRKSESEIQSLLSSFILERLIEDRKKIINQIAKEACYDYSDIIQEVELNLT
jgi:hypothetical protein